MILLSAEKIKKSYGEKILMQDASLSLSEGDKVGVVGVNGTGKSTLLKILAGLESPDEGSITKASGITIGYLPQIPVFADNNTVLQQVFQDASEQIKELKEYEAKSVLTKLGFTDLNQEVWQLSGGQKKRLAIARALIIPCEVLILDEPTNHIDSETVLWLEKYLAKFTGAVLMVTHDRYFLDRVTNHIVEIDHGGLYRYDNSNFSRFLERKEEREEIAQGTERKRQSILKKELEWIQRGVRARGTKSKSRIQRYEELSQQENRKPDAKLELDSISTRLGKKTIELMEVSKGFEERQLIKDFSFLLHRGGRIGIIGPNGCGKSTLLKLILGELSPDQGSVTIGETVKFGYFSQECEEMDLSLRVIDYIREIAEVIQTVGGPLTATQMLEKFLFPGELQYTQIGRLSGGEKRRLFLLRVLMEAPNVLLLDEPTNDLDIQTLMILEEYLQTFHGAVIAVSHDRYFLDKTVDHILEFQPGGTIRQYLGGYTDYFEESAVENRLKAGNAAKGKEEKKGRAASSSKKLKFSYNEQREYEQIDEVIEDLEQKLADLEQEIETASSDFTRLQELLTKKESIENQLEEKTERWIYLNELAERIEAQKQQ